LPTLDRAILAIPPGANHRRHRTLCEIGWPHTPANRIESSSQKYFRANHGARSGDLCRPSPAEAAAQIPVRKRYLAPSSKNLAPTAQTQSRPESHNSTSIYSDLSRQSCTSIRGFILPAAIWRWNAKPPATTGQLEKPGTRASMRPFWQRSHGVFAERARLLQRRARCGHATSWSSASSGSPAARRADLRSITTSLGEPL